MSAHRFRVVVASGVRHAADYLAILARDERVEVVAVVEERSARDWVIADGERAAAAAGVPFSLVSDMSSLSAVAGPADLVIVCSEPTRHARLAGELMRAGHDVLVDKPVATTLADADAVLDTAEETGRVCGVVNRTLAPALCRLRSWVDAGRVGLPRHVDLEFLASGRHFATSVERPELVVDRALSGGGEILNFAGYLIDAVHHLTGLAVLEVHAFAGALFSEPHRAAGVEDTAVLTLELERGVTATLTVGRVPFAPGSAPTASSVRLLGSHGHAVVDDEAPAVTRDGPDGRTELVRDTGRIAVEAYLDHVVTRLAAGSAPDYGARQARDTVAVIEAAYRSVGGSLVAPVAARKGP